jgi:CheY-like chemotaxis protein
MATPTRVLIVDDDPSLADLMANQLSELREGFSIRVETNPNDALDAVDTGNIDCVLSDYHMPEMDGLELLRYVREMEHGIPFILFTSRGSEEIASEAVSEGVTDYFRKRRGTEQWEVLANRIENSAARYRAERAVQRREAALHDLARTVIDSVSTPVEELLELGRETLDVEYGALVQGEGANAEILVESVDGSVPYPTADGPTLVDDLDDLTVDGGSVVTGTADGDGNGDGEEFSAYIGSTIYVGDRRYGTLCFCDRTEREGFSEWERTFVELLGDWLGNELTGEWARDRDEAVRSARSRIERVREAIDESDDETAREELDAIAELLDQDPPSATAVSIELS